MMTANRRSRLALYAGLALFAAFALAPYLWVLRTSLLENLAAMSNDTAIIPFFAEGFTTENYAAIFQEGGMDFTLYFRNSLLVAVSSTILSLLWAIPGAYAFARLDFPGRRWLFYTTVFTIMFPWIVLTVPVYEIFNDIGLINTFGGLIIALSIFVTPLCIWLLQGFFRDNVPANIEEAAMIDGTTQLGAFFRIVLPLSIPAIGATALFAFLNAWNNFVWMFILTNSESKRTATVALHYIVASDLFRQYNAVMTAVVILALPPILFYGLVHNYVGEGLGGGY